MPSPLMSYSCATVEFSKLCLSGDNVSQAGYKGEPKLQDSIKQLLKEARNKIKRNRLAGKTNEEMPLRFSAEG